LRAHSGVDGTELWRYDGGTSDERMGFEVDSLETKARLDFGCAVLDHVGLVKNDGA